MPRSYDFEWFKVKRLPRYGWVVDRSPAVVVVAVSPDDGLWLEQIERVPTGMSSWEMPGGGVQHGESIVTAALRELEEECGLVATDGARQLGQRFEIAPGMGKVPHFIVLARGVVPKGKKAVAQKSEGIVAVRKFSRNAVQRMVTRGDINVFATLGPLAVTGWLGGRTPR